MPDLQIIKGSLDAIADNPNHSKAQAVMEKLGLDQTAVNAWKTVKDNPDHPKAAEVKNKIFDKIANTLPADPVKGRFEVGPLSFNERFDIKNLLDRDPIAAQKFLETRTDDKGNRKYIARVKDGKLEVRKPGEPTFKDIEFDGMDIIDPFDIVFDIAKGAFEGAAASAAGLAAAPLGPVAMGSAMMTAGTLAGSATESLKQGIAVGTGLREEFDPGRIAQEGIISGASSLIGPAAQRGAKIAGKYIAETAPKLVPNAQQIREAGKRLGIKPMLRQLYDNDTVHLLEENLQKVKGTLPGAFIRRQAKQNVEKLDDIADAMIGSAKNVDIVDVGENAKNLIKRTLTKRLEPIEKIYNNVQDFLKGVDDYIDFDFLNKRADELIGANKFDDAAVAAVNKFKGKIGSIDNLADLKEYRSTIFRNIKEAQAKKNFAEVRALSDIYEVLTKARSKSLDAMIDNAPQRGSELAQAAKVALAKADKEYAILNQEVRKALLERGKKSIQSAKQIVDGFDELLEKDFVRKMLNVNDPKRLIQFKKEFPIAFEILREGKIAEIAKAAMNNKKNVLRIGTIMDRIEKMPRASKKLIFGEDAIQKVKDLQILFKTMPPPLNPSQTSHNLMSPVGWYKAVISNFSALGSRARLSVLTNQEALGKFLEKAAETIGDTGAIAISRSIIRNEIPTEAQQRSFGIRNFAPVDLNKLEKEFNFGVPSK